MAGNVVYIVVSRIKWECISYKSQDNNEVWNNIYYTVSFMKNRVQNANENGKLIIHIGIVEENS